jgi:hypothetical protein
MFKGDVIGDVEVFYGNAGYIEGEHKAPHHPCKWKNTYILEGRINRFLFEPLPLEGGLITLHWAECCGNDYITLEGDIDHPSAPEPTTLFLLAVGLLGLGGFGLKNLKNYD